MAEPLATRTATTPAHAASAPAWTSTPSNGTAAPSWTPGNRGAALLLPDTDDLRVEFTPGR